MRSLPAVTATLSLLLLPSLPSIALACGGEPGQYYEHFGAAAFGPDGEITAITPTDAEVYDWLAIDSQTRTGRGGIDTMPAMESNGPRIRVTAHGSFALIAGSLFRAGDQGRASTPELTGLATYDVSRDGAIVAASWIDEIGTARIALYRNDERTLRDTLQPISESDAGSCDLSRIAVARLPGGAVAGLCGDAPFRLDGDVISIEPALGIGTLDAVEAAGLDADGSMTFFATAPDADDYQSTRLFAIRRTIAGEWSKELIATLPLTAIADGRLAPASAEAGAIAGWDGYYSLEMDSFRRVDGVWVTEEIGFVQSEDRVTARGDAASMEVLAGGYSLRSFSKDAQSGTWTESDLGTIGMSGFVPGEGFACSVTGVSDASPTTGFTMLALALGLVLRARRPR